MENAASDHYFSEKLIDCILLEAVPIYYGCPGITELLDPRGILPFKTNEELAAITDRLSPSLYDEMRPFAILNKQKVIDEDWHSHHGLFCRIAAWLAEHSDLPQPVVPKSSSLVRRVAAFLRRGSGS
jgi:hypothetical protein